MIGTLGPLTRYVGELAERLGRELQAFEDIATTPGFISAAARTVPERGNIVENEVRLQILEAPDELGGRHVWALVFPFVGGKRVRAVAGDYVVLLRDTRGLWHSKGWERDEFEEWEDTELPEART